MTNEALAQSYLRKALDRLDVLDLLMGKSAWSDVVREAQEIVELALKAMLREVGVEPPKWHDVGGILKDERGRFAPDVQVELDELARISEWLRAEREVSFYGDDDVVPTEAYDEEDGARAVADARRVVTCAQRVVRGPLS
jgi:HEPN domain-containing protein